MILETKRLILRKPKISDWKDIFEGIGQYDVSKMLLKVPYPYTKKDAIEYLKKQEKIWKSKDMKDYTFVIELKSEKKVIGAIGIHWIDFFSGIGTTGSWINKKYWKNGYMTEAKIVVNDFAFNELRLRRLNSEVFTNNKASNATQLKMGYILEGVKRSAVKSKTTKKIYDENIYGLLKKDWQKAKKKFKKQS
jgi:ribosomal-protein-alanine N-acetyltransferase